MNTVISSEKWRQLETKHTRRTTEAKNGFHGDGCQRLRHGDVKGRKQTTGLSSHKAALDDRTRQTTSFPSPETKTRQLKWKKISKTLERNRIPKNSFSLSEWMNFFNLISACRSVGRFDMTLWADQIFMRRHFKYQSLMRKWLHPSILVYTPKNTVTARYGTFQCRCSVLSGESDRHRCWIL